MKHEESQIQKGCVLWFRKQYRKLRFLLFAIPNGAMLNGTQSQRAMSGKRMKEEGVVSGVADLFLSVPSGDVCGLYIEMKTKTGRQTDSQKEFEQSVLEAGYGYVICRSLEQFQDVVRNYLENAEY